MHLFTIITINYYNYIFNKKTSYDNLSFKEEKKIRK